MEDGYDWFIKQINHVLGIDLTQYKEEQMKRRLTSLRNKYQLDHFYDFYTLIQQSQKIKHECLDKMTINVSEFFRNRERWKDLVATLTQLWTDKKRCNIWSAACSTGEEPYTLSILFHQMLPIPHRIYATDIDEKVLETAEKGIYDYRQFKELSADEVSRYFIKKDEGYMIKPVYQQSVTFCQHNLLSSTYEGCYDLIVCRNVLIYFTDEAKMGVYKRFSEALNRNGILFVGSTEQIFKPEVYGLKAIGKFIYQKI
ncbi:CheR family methyltransferase [Tuberibacillus sp. Marseille-P3662]|uniref:CheR family methyltransferase n=1 Tax=Tuberibacillus sp. Marseille-P3662 TaxID=1965358 RepID=UPI000A1C7DC7|nr:protein-glutamate O-methyltransferase CheR [Tuberibacillus sp. Marseille-P3662]